MNSLFGLELPAPVNFVIAFVVVMALIGAATWAVRRFGGARMEAASRNRQPRLAVVDSAAVDGRRKLVIVRRDNVEHLLMIGGPTDVVVESSIVRGGAVAAREPSLREPPARTASPDTLPRVMPLPDPTPWPLAPEPAARAEPVAHVAHVEEPVRGAPPVEPKPAVRSVSREPSPPVDDTADAGDLSHTRPEPLAPRAAAPAAQPSARAFASAEPNPDDTNLAEMAQRLEAALRRPMPTTGEPRKPAAAAPAPAKRAPEPRPAPRPQPRAVIGAALARSAPAGAAAEPAPDAAAAAAQTKTEFENLEQEMASLLGRSSSGKT